MQQQLLGQAPKPNIQIRLGYELIYDCPQPTPMVLTLSVHFSRVCDLVVPDHMITAPSIPISAYRDGFGNWCSRVVAPAGEVSFSADAVINDSGVPDVVVPTAWQVPVELLPEETLMFLLGSRYCDTERLSQVAWDLFGQGPTGWARVQAICDYVHNHIAFDYQKSSPSRTAFEAFNEKQGVCRDYAHLAIAFCRCLNLPARYCTGYLGDIGVPPAPPGDFSAWFEVYLGGAWYIFDARNNIPRIGRVLIARGRDAADVPISNTFGFNTLKSFRVWTDKVSGERKKANEPQAEISEAVAHVRFAASFGDGDSGYNRSEARPGTGRGVFAPNAQSEFWRR